MHDCDIAENRRSLVMSEIMTPNMSNFQGNVHGGYVLAFLDKVAYACAARYTGSNVVTLSVDEVLFKEPIYVGELVLFYASINYVGRSSLEVGIRVVAENIISSTSRHTNTCYFTMVCVDENGKPQKAPELQIHNETQRRRFDEAVVRKEARLKVASYNGAR